MCGLYLCEYVCKCVCGVQRGYMFISLLPVWPSDFLYRKDLDMPICFRLCIVELQTSFQMLSLSHTLHMAVQTLINHPE